jgi:ribonuclease Z
MVAGSNIKRLILGHFSSRYDDDEIDEAITQGCDQNAIEIPVFRILPGRRADDVLANNVFD